MTDFSRVFALEFDGRPKLAFEAKNTRQAQELCKESWLRDDLVSLKSGGVPLGTAQSKLSIRLATDEETVIYERATEIANPSDEILLAYARASEPKRPPTDGGSSVPAVPF
jgi:hypothetical protein